MSNKSYIKVWVYRILDRALKFPDCKSSPTNQLVPTNVYGQFEYYTLQDGVIESSTRDECDKWCEVTDSEPIFYNDYPLFMKEQGYK